MLNASARNKPAGYNVAAAEDVFGALLQLRKMLPDLIISDLI
jgi:CheY-like chemotaxis protein